MFEVVEVDAFGEFEVLSYDYEGCTSSFWKGRLHVIRLIALLAPLVLIKMQCLRLSHHLT